MKYFNNATMVVGKIIGTVMSGESIKTTFGNTLRIIILLMILCILAKLRWKR